MAERRRGLGRGLGALIPASTEGETQDAEAKTSTEQSEAEAAVSVSRETKKKSSSKKAETGASSGSGDLQPDDSSSSEQRKSSSKTSPSKQKASKGKASGQEEAASSASAPATQEGSGVKGSASSRPNSKAGGTQRRADMGAALRKSGVGRRPVDFFFEPSEPTGETQEGAVPEVEQSSDGDQGVKASASEKAKKPSSHADRPSGDSASVSRETEQEGDDSSSGNQLVAVPGAHFGEIGVDEIHPNRKQPRQEFDEDEMQELVHSIREIGVLQPIVVRRSREEGDAKYELVMGERRWRASQRAEMPTIPAIVRDTQDVDLLRDALLENLHRSQLNPLEEAAAYQQLLHEFGTTQEELARRIGRSRPQISNTIRLLRLPALVQRRVAAGILSAGHARALLVLEDPAAIERLAQRIVAEGLSVRATEEIAQAGETPKKEKARKATPSNRHHERLDYIADAFADKLDTSVKINLGARKGKMTIEFASVDDLNRIISVLDPEIEKD